MLQHWRANVDLQMIVDVQACARYMAKYAAKGECRSHSLQSLYKSCVEHLNNNSGARRILRSALLRSVGERDFSAQETSHMLLSLPLFSCTYNFVTVALNSSRKLTRDDNSGELTLEPSALDDYATRDGSLAHLNLCQFVSNYHTIRGRVTKRSAPVIVRTFPSFSSNPQSHMYDQYCKFQLVKYRPWTASPSHAWETNDFVAAYTDYLQTNEATHYIPNFAQELEQAQQNVAANNDDNEDVEDTNSTEQDDWMLCCRLNQHFLLECTPNTTSFDWPAFARSLPPDVIRDCPSWIKVSRAASMEDPTSQWHRQLPTVDTSILTAKQNLAYTIILDHYRQLTLNQHPLPLQMIVCGTAGTGKSYLISAIAQTLREACILTGTTGMASFNICGKTLHSTLQLPVRATQHKDLQGTALQRLQATMKDKHYLIIDEMSMMGQRMFAWVDRRLRQTTGCLDKPLGGISVVLFGDFAQLPPVGDLPLYAAPTNHALSIHGYTIYRTFSTVVILDQVLRQAGTDPSICAFRELLLRLRDGNVTQEDWQTLLQRSPPHVNNEEKFTNAIHLFYDRLSVSQFNQDRLSKLGTPIAAINAVHSSPIAAAAKAEDAGGLHPVIFLAKNARVMLTANLWPEVGLCNGATGEIIDFLYQEQHAPPNLPIAVLVHFYKYTGPLFLQNSIPIVPLTFEWTSGKHNLSRQQLPLQPCYAITIHKSQGQTLEKAVIDLGKTEMAAGTSFVAVSRLKTLEDGLFQPMTFQRLKAIGQSKRLLERKQEELHLHHLSQNTVSSHH